MIDKDDRHRVSGFGYSAGAYMKGKYYERQAMGNRKGGCTL